MEKLNLEITDKRFDALGAPKYELSLLAGTDGLSYLATDGAGEVMALKSWRFLNPENRFKDVESAIRHIFGGEEKLNLPFGKVRAAVYNNFATLVPNRLFNPSELPAYFRLLLRPGNNLSYAFDDLPELEAKMVFAVDSEISHLIGQYFPQTQLSHSSSSLIKAWERLARRNDYDIFVNLRNHVAQIAVFDRKHLLFFNSFAFAKASDFLYFVLLAYEQNRLNPLETPLIVSGELMEESEIYRLVYRYVRTLRFVQLPDYYQFPGPFQAIPAHFNFDLYSLKLG